MPTLTKLLGILTVGVTYAMSGFAQETHTSGRLLDGMPPGTKLVLSKPYYLEFCPDNTCDKLIVTKPKDRASFIDFAYLYLYFFSSYAVLDDWRATPEASHKISSILAKRATPTCPSKPPPLAAQCLFRQWAVLTNARLYLIRYDEHTKNTELLNLYEATSSAKPLTP